jgi:hypothetical protein
VVGSRRALVRFINLLRGCGQRLPTRFSNPRVIPGRAAGRVQSGRGAVLGVYELDLGLGQEFFDAVGRQESYSSARDFDLRDGRWRRGHFGRPIVGCAMVRLDAVSPVTFGSI